MIELGVSFFFFLFCGGKISNAYVGVFVLQTNKKNRGKENRDEGARGTEPFGELEGCSSQAGAREFRPRDHRPQFS